MGYGTRDHKESDTTEHDPVTLPLPYCVIQAQLLGATELQYLCLHDNSNVYPMAL